MSQYNITFELYYCYIYVCMYVCIHYMVVIIACMDQQENVCITLKHYNICNDACMM